MSDQKSRTEFDFETCWFKMAKPQFEALPQNVRDTYAMVSKYCGELSQLPDLTMPWPTDGHLMDPKFEPGSRALTAAEFRQRFVELDSELLAQAARVIHNYGHWNPGVKGQDNTGAHWKFSHYADQVLRERLGILGDRVSGKQHGLGMEIHEGALRRTYATPSEWTWEEIGWATEGNLKRALAVSTPMLPATEEKRGGYRTSYVDTDKYFAALKVACASESFIACTDLDPYMVEQGTLTKRSEMAREASNDAKHSVEDFAAAVAAIHRAENAKREVFKPLSTEWQMALEAGVSEHFKQAVIALVLGLQSQAPKSIDEQIIETLSDKINWEGKK